MSGNCELGRGLRTREKNATEGGAGRFEKTAPDARAAPPKAHESLIARKTVEEVPLTGLSSPQRVVRVYSLETGQKMHDLTKHTDWITAAADSPDGALLATGDRAGGVVIWDAASGRDFLTLQPHPASITGIAWRADSNMVATSCEDGQIRLWELENGNQLKAWGAHGGGAAAVEFVRDGRLVSVGRDRTPKLWTPDGTQERAFEACADVGLAASFCDETNRLLVGDWTGEIRVWNAADGARVGALDPNPISLADRAAAADREVAARQAKLDEAAKAIAPAEAAVAALAKKRKAALAAKATADGQLAELQKQVDAQTALVAAARQAHAEAAAALVTIDQQIAAAVAPRDVMKAVADAATQKLAQVDAALAAATAQQQQAAAHAADLKNQVEQARGLHAKWLAEVVFQSNYEGLFKALAEREQVLTQAEMDLAAADGKRQADEQARQGAIAKQGGMQKQIEALTAAIATAEQEITTLAGQIEKRVGELPATQATIDKTLEAIAVLGESGKSLAPGLAAAPDDADLKAAQAALTAAIQAKQGQLKQHQDVPAAQTAEKAAWEKAIADKRTGIEKHKADIAAVQAAMPAVAAEIDAATKAVAESTRLVEEKRAGVATRQADVDAQAKQLDALQGIAG